MAISDDLNSIRTHLEDDYTALEQLGVSVEDRNIENIKDMANQIYAKFPKTSYAEGSNITLFNTLKGKLDFEDEDGKKKIGFGQTEQKSYQGYQLIPYTLATLKAINTVGTWNNNVYTYNGITYTIEEENGYIKEIKTTGTATSNSILALISTMDIGAGTYYLSGCPNGGSYSTYFIYSGPGLAHNVSETPTTITFNEDTSLNSNNMKITILSGTSLSNLIWKPMLSKTNTTDFEPFVGNSPSPNPSYQQDIEVVRGKNILPNNATTQTVNGVTFTKYDDGSVLVNGTATANIQYDLLLASENKKISAGNYYLSGCPSGGTAETYRLVIGVNGTLYGEYGSGRAVTLASGVLNSYIYIQNGATVTNKLYKPMLEKGSQATSYLPYNTLEVGIRSTNLVKSKYVNPTVSSYLIVLQADFDIKPSTTYTISFNGREGNKVYFNEYLFDGPATQTYLTIGSGRTIKTITTKDTISDSQKNSNGWYIFKNQAGNTEANIFDDLQIEEGSTATTYEPYQTPQTYQLSLGDKELYTDSEIIRNNDGSWSFIDEYYKQNITSSNVISSTTNLGTYMRINLQPMKTTINNANIKSYCNIAPYLANYSSQILHQYCDTVMRLFISNDSLSSTDIAGAKEFIDNNNIYFLYKLATPIETPITDTTLIEQLNNWYNSHSFTGTTIIEIDGQLPLIIKVRALKGN